MLNEADYMKDHRGNLVPIESIKEIDIMRDDLVNRIVNMAKQVSSTLENFKSTAMGEIATFVDFSAEKYGVKYGGVKGNIQLLSFDGRFKVIKSVNEYMVFDERLQAAKALLDKYVTIKADGAAPEIRTLLNFAFEVDKAGKINTDRILSLRRIAISDPLWKQAMEAISDSIQFAGSKEYIRVYVRNKDGKYDQLPLDLSAV